MRECIILPDQQGNTQGILQRTDRSTHRRLGEIQLVGSLRKAVFLHDRQKNFQIFNGKINHTRPRISTRNNPRTLLFVVQ